MRMRPGLLFSNFHLSFSFRENDRVFFGRAFRFRETVTLCYGTQLRYWDFSSFGSPLGESNGVESFRGTSVTYRGNPNQIFGLRILLVSFSKKTTLPAWSCRRHRGEDFLSPGFSSLWFYYNTFHPRCQGGFCIFLYLIHNSYKYILKLWSF